MRENRPLFAAPMRRRATVLIGLACLPAPALAQYSVRAPPPLPAAPRPGEVQSPASALARAIRTLAQYPRDFNALIDAGRAAVDLGDMQSAIGFFGRAEEVRPSDPAPKIGMGAATVATGDASGALRWFYQAQQLGATSAAIGADRGLAQDLLGNQAAAQIDYRAALGGREADEARRRLALSLGISGDRSGAFAILQPLLMRRDPAAQRDRAFVLALAGDDRGASSAIDSAMPGTGSRMAGFFRLLPSLSAPQKAAAVHLGIFPDPSQIRVAAVSPRIIPAPIAQRMSPAPPARVRTAPPPILRESSRQVRITRGARVAPPLRSPIVVAETIAPVINASPSAVAASNTPMLPSAAATVDLTTTPAATGPQPGFSAAPSTPDTGLASVAEPLKFELPSESVASVTPVATAPTEPVTAEPVAPSVSASGDRLSGIDRLLAQADELPVPPAPRPKFETPAKVAAVDPAKIKKAAELKKAVAAQKAADAKKIADDKAARESIGLAGTHWVQLAGGANADRMGTEFRRLGAKSAALRKRGGAVTGGKDYFRLVTGPFATKSEAQSFVNQLAKDGVDGFSWTRTPATLRIEKIPAR